MRQCEVTYEECRVAVHFVSFPCETTGFFFVTKILYLVMYVWLKFFLICMSVSSFDGDIYIDGIIVMIKWVRWVWWVSKAKLKSEHGEQIWLQRPFEVTWDGASFCEHWFVPFNNSNDVSFVVVSTLLSGEGQHCQQFLFFSHDRLLNANNDLIFRHLSAYIREHQRLPQWANIITTKPILYSWAPHFREEYSPPPSSIHNPTSLLLTPRPRYYQQ